MVWSTTWSGLLEKQKREVSVISAESARASLRHSTIRISKSLNMGMIKSFFLLSIIEWEEDQNDSWFLCDPWINFMQIEFSLFLCEKSRRERKEENFRCRSLNEKPKRGNNSVTWICLKWILFNPWSLSSWTYDVNQLLKRSFSNALCCWGTTEVRNHQNDNRNG